MLPEIELRVARFLGVPISAISDPTTPLASPRYHGAHLRRVRDTDSDRLSPAIHAALRIAEATVRNLRSNVPSPTQLPANGLTWRKEIEHSDSPVTLDDLLTDLWTRGIPVIPVDVLPAPSFQGLAAIVRDGPVIIVGHKHDEPGRAAFLVAHEAGHIAAGDCTTDAPVIDEDEEIASDHEMEERADRFAVQVLVGGDEIPQVATEAFDDFRELAKQAARLERETGADAGSIIFSWARRTGDYQTATMATKALYRASGARRTLRDYFERFVEVVGAPETDRELLRSVVSDVQGRDAPVG